MIIQGVNLCHAVFSTWQCGIFTNHVAFVSELQYMEINIMNIKLSRPCMKSRTRKIYVQCKSGLSHEDEENIKQCPMGMMNIKFYPNGLPIKNIGKIYHLLYNALYTCRCSPQYT